MRDSFLKKNGLEVMCWGVQEVQLWWQLLTVNCQDLESPRDEPLGMPVRDYMIKLIAMWGPILKVGGTIPQASVLDCIKRRKLTEHTAFTSLLLDRGCNLTGHLMFPLPWPPQCQVPKKSRTNTWLTGVPISILKSMPAARLPQYLGLSSALLTPAPVLNLSSPGTSLPCP